MGHCIRGLSHGTKRQIFGGILLAGCATGSPKAAPADAPPATAPELIAASLRALGAERHPLPHAFELVMDGRNLRGNWTQAYRWTDTTPLPIPTRLRYVVDPSTRRALYEFRSPAPGDIWFNYRTEYDTSGAWQIDLMGWRLGTDVARATATAARTSLTPIERLLPDVALAQAQSGQSLRLAPDGVSYIDAAGDSVTIQIDRASLLPVAIVNGRTRVELSDFRPVEGLLVPFVRRTLTNGQATEQRVVSVDLRPELNVDRFALPSGYADPPAAGAPRATPLGAGLYRLDALPGGYHSAFVVREQDVAVLEAPQTPQASEAALRVIAAVAPGKRVTQVFVTHHHNDHVGGLSTYVSGGAELVVGAGLEEAIRRQLPDSLRVRARFVAVSKRQSFGEGADRIEAIPIVNTHAEGNVAFYVPAARAVFQGDLFYIPERGAIPPAFGVTEAFASAVLGCHLGVETVIGVHGRTGSWSELETSLRLANRERVKPAPCP